MSCQRKIPVFILLIAAFLVSCATGNHKKSNADTPTSGTIFISVDESFRPVIEQEIAMFEASYPEAHIIASYKSEADCFKDFFRDSSNRLIIVGRGLSRKEEKYMIDSLGYNPGCNAVASDAVTVIVNAKSNDTLFSLNSLQKLLSGKSYSNQNTVVFDGLNATSTVRFIKDSILKGAAYDTSVVKAVKNSADVISYVGTHENAIGLVGISWIGNPEDSAQVKLLKTVKMGYVKCDICESEPYVKPMQESMITRRYPLVRNVYYINKENYEGLGTGFTSFLKFERGQLIFKRSYLGPVMDFEVRNVQINRTLPKK
jgi:phosphate transport system substrate-binding protein